MNGQNEFKMLRGELLILLFSERELKEDAQMNDLEQYENI